MRGTAEKLKQILKDRHGLSFPLVIAVMLVMMLLLCGISEYFRLYIIASGVRESVQNAIISTVSDNYVGVYHGAREGYSGSYQTDGSTSWEQAVTEGDVYCYLNAVIGTKKRGGSHVKYAGDSGTTVEFSITGLSVTVRNAPLAPSDPRNAQRFEADALVRLEVPVRFCGKLLPSMRITLKVQAGYVEIF